MPAAWHIDRSAALISLGHRSTALSTLLWTTGRLPVGTSPALPRFTPKQPVDNMSFRTFVVDTRAWCAPVVAARAARCHASGVNGRPRAQRSGARGRAADRGGTAGRWRGGGDGQ